MTLSRDQILAADDIKRELVAVPEWGGEVYVKGLSALERDRFEASVLDQSGGGRKIKLENFRARLAALSICDENGKPIFEASDIPALGAKSAAALDRVLAVSQRLSAMTEQDVSRLTGELKKDLPAVSP